MQPQMVRYLHQKLLEHKWIESNQPHLGTFVRRSDGSYARTTSDSSVLHLVETVAAPVVFTMSCDAVSVLLEETTVNMTSITFTDGTVLPVATSVLDVHYDRSFARNGFYACLCRKESFILVAASTPSELLAQSSTLESNCVGRASLSDQRTLSLLTRPDMGIDYRATSTSTDCSSHPHTHFVNTRSGHTL